MSQSFVTHNDERERIMTFVPEELPTFSIKSSTCQTSSPSNIPGRDPSKIIPWYRLRNPGLEIPVAVGGDRSARGSVHPALSLIIDNRHAGMPGHYCNLASRSSQPVVGLFSYCCCIQRNLQTCQGRSVHSAALVHFSKLSIFPVICLRFVIICENQSKN